MLVQIRELESGTRIKLRHPRTGESGVWLIVGRIKGSGLEDPAYDIQHERRGRVRVVRRSRMKLLRRAR